MHDNLSRFLVWYAKRHRLCGAIYTSVGFLSLLALAGDFLYSGFWKTILLGLWYCAFAVFGHVYAESLLCDAATRFKSGNV